MHYAIGILILVAALGFAAGFFLAPVPMIIVALVAVVWTVNLYRSSLSGPPGTSGGIGVMLFSLLGPYFLFFLVLGAFIGYGGCSAIWAYDWASMSRSLSGFFLRQ